MNRLDHIAEARAQVLAPQLPIFYYQFGLGWPGAIGSGMWCGAFMAYIFRDLLPKIRYHSLASTYRLWLWAHSNERWVKPEDVRPGDIAVVGVVGRGKHIVLVTERVGDDVETISGNTWVWPGGGKPRFIGVGHRKYTVCQRNAGVFRVLYGIRPLESDYTP